MRKAGLVLTLLMTVSLLSALSVSMPVKATAVTGPYVDQITYFATTDESIALGDISAGTTDLYLWRVPYPLVSKARANPNLQLVPANGGYLCLLFNPAPTTTAFNPFSIKAVRQAMQYLINRDYIVNILHLGDASPKIIFYGRYDADYAYLADYAEAMLSKYLYNFQTANAMVTSALTAVGCVKGSNGKWTKNGTVITLNPLIRADDPIRKTVGDILATDLETMGFVVNRNYGDLNRAYAVVYGTDPMDNAWSFYTEGYRSSAISRYDVNGMPQMYCPYFGNMPGWQEPGWWQYENATLDDIGDRFASGNFLNLNDRAALMRQGAQMGFEESVRLFLVDQIYRYPYNSRFEPFAYELMTGTQTPWAMYTIRDPDVTDPSGVGGSIKAAQKLMYQGAYNIVNPNPDVYSSNILDLVTDFAVFTDPHTGLYIPVRSTYTVITAGPSGKLDVPSDVEKYDYMNHKWTTVGPGVQAITNITFTFKLSNWHHGLPMTQADTREAFYFLWEWATRGVEGVNDTRYDSSFAGVQSTLVNSLVGVKFIGDNIATIYANYWFPDDSQIAGFFQQIPGCFPFPSIPWEVCATSERVVAAKLASYSRAGASAMGRPWLDYVAPAAGLPELKANLTEMQSANYLPDSGKNGTTGLPLPGFDDASRTARYAALQSWVAAHNHFLVSNGAFYLDTTDRVAGQDIIKAFRDPTYPFKPGDWNYLIPVNSPEISTEAPSSVVIGKDVVINVKATIGGQPSSAADIVYLVLDSASNVVINGRAVPSSIIGTFQIILNSTQTALLNAGGYSLKIIAYSSSLIVPRFDSKVFTALPPFEEIIGADIAQLRTDLSSVNTRVTGLGTTTSDIQARVAGLEGTVSTLTTTLYVVVALLIVSIVVAVLGYMRKKP